MDLIVSGGPELTAKLSMAFTKCLPPECLDTCGWLLERCLQHKADDRTSFLELMDRLELMSLPDDLGL